MMFKKKQQLIIIIVATLLIADFVFFGYLPLKKRMDEIKQSRRDQMRIISDGLNKRKQLPGLDKQLQELERQAVNFDLQIPRERLLGDFLQKIASLMKTHELEEQLIQPNTEIKTDLLNCIPITIQCRGSLEQLFGFFESVQQLDRLVRIESIKLGNERDYSGIVSMETKANIYYRPVLKES